MATVKYPEPLIFGLDIGTRSIVGTVGYREQNNFHVVAMAVKFHDTRSMIDGQIHDIAKVSEDIVSVKQQLEEQLGGRKLTEVCIAAAGRVLKTAVGHGEYQFTENTTITQEYIHSIDLIGVEKAHEQIMEELQEKNDHTKYFCVGYTVIKYYLNDYEISNLEGHKGTKIAAEVLATFLPEEVVDSLYAAVEQAGLYVANLTLEPIAAIQLAIPESYRLLNIALIDVGAGTSDICITKDGSIIGYGMIPSAGDELTEALIKKYLIDFNTAEMLKTVNVKRKSVTYKDIMGIPHKITPDEIYKTMDSVKADITKKIAEKIIKLNGGTPVSAAFVVGGGGKLGGFTELISKALKLPPERVALRGEEVMNDVYFHVEGIQKDPLYVTPIGICLNYFEQKNNFIFVTVNGDRVKLYNNDKLTIFDAAVQYGYPNEDIFPKRGDDITFKINGKTRIVRGYDGEPAVILQNGNSVGMNAAIEANDVISIEKSTKGNPAELTLGSLPEYAGTLTFLVNGTQVVCPKFAVVNKEPATELYQIQDGDEVEMQNFYTVEQLLTFADIPRDVRVVLNNKEASLSDKVYENFEFAWEEVEQKVAEESDDKSDDKSEDKQDSGDAKKKRSSGQKKAGKKSEDSGEAEDVAPVVKKEPISMAISVNRVPVVMTGKAEYQFVDLFDFYEFDLTTVRGNRLVTTVDGENAQYTQPLHEGALVEVYWEQ